MLPASGGRLEQPATASSYIIVVGFVAFVGFVGFVVVVVVVVVVVDRGPAPPPHGAARTSRDDLGDDIGDDLGLGPTRTDAAATAAVRAFSPAPSSPRGAPATAPRRDAGDASSATITARPPTVPLGPCGAPRQ